MGLAVSAELYTTIYPLFGSLQASLDNDMHCNVDNHRQLPGSLMKEMQRLTGKKRSVSRVPTEHVEQLLAWVDKQLVQRFLICCV